MVPDDPDEPSFLKEMAMLGVKPLDARKKKPGQKQGQKPGQTQGKAQGQTQGKAPPSTARKPPLAGREPPVQAPKPGMARTPAAAPAARQAPEQAPEQAISRELEALRQSLAAAEAARRAAEDEARRTLDAERQARGEERQAWEQERKALLEQGRELGHKLARAERAAAAHRSLLDVLEDRGLAGADEAIRVLQSLMEKRPTELMQAIQLTSAEPLASLLEQRVALVAHDLDVNLGPDCVIVRVSPERCEISGGSDIRVHFRRLLDACRQAQVHKLTIVGGSPAYRSELKRLAEPHHKELELNLVSGTQRRERKRADADMRTSDLVVIWGATELDHSVSSVYTRAENRLIVRHRGISRMLSEVAAHLGRK